MSRQWIARTEPKILELIDQVGNLDELQKVIAQMIARDGVAATVATARSACEHALALTNRPSAIGAIHVAMIRTLHLVDLQAALRFGDACLPDPPQPRSLHTLALHHKLAGNFERALSLFDRIGHDPDADADTITARKDQRFETAMELELRAVRDAFATDETTARAITDRMLADRDDRQLSILCRLFAREAQVSSPLRKLWLSRLDVLAAKPQLPPETAYRLSTCYLKLGYVSKARHAISLGTTDDPQAPLHRRAIENLVELSARGFAYAPARTPYTPEPGRLLYVLHSSLPHHSSGYATRTHGLLGGIASHGWKASGVTRLGYPQDLGALQKIPVEPQSVVDRITYHRLSRPGPLFSTLPKAEYLTAYADAVCEIARREKPQILHAAADHHNGLAATAAARTLGIKSIYEVRGLWEITRGSREPEWMETEYFKLMSDLEAQAARDADAVVVITRALGREMAERGVPTEKMTLVPNGVDIARFVPRPRDQVLADRLGLRGKRVIGYVGSIVDYEGLDLLVTALDKLHRRGLRDVALLIVGDGVALEGIKKLARELGVDRHTVFTGRVPHHEVEAHYSLIDIAPFPRKSLPVTEMVSPLKPLEAMAMNKIVVASDVAALAEMIEPGINGLTFAKDDVEDLAAVLARVLAGDATPKAPREWVETHRSWDRLAGTVVELYKQLTA